ncbi:unnamed protein product [Ixodes pacificus]
MPLPDTNSRASPDERSTSPSRNNNMDFQDLEHEDSDGVDTQGDWIDVVSKHSKKKNKRMYEGNDKVKPTPLSVDTKTTAVKPVSLPRPPALPIEVYKMVIRPKDGLDLKKYHVSTLSDSILAAAKLMWKQAELRIRVDEEQNIITISTSREEAARALSTVTQIDIQGKKYGINLYGLSPHDSCKGVIHEIPAHHTSKDILESLWLPGYEFIACRRLGKTNSVAITVLGTKVPFYIYYRGAEIRCYIYKKTVPYCHTCHKLGHRADVCPTPTVVTCDKCGTHNPQQEHSCNPACALCQGSHLTASKDCKQRYKELYILRKKKWEKENNQQQYEDTTRRPRSRGRHDDDHYRPRSRSQSFPRLRGGTSRSHSRPRVSVDRRDCDSGRARSGPGASADRDVRAENYAECTVNQVNWAKVLSSSAPLPNAPCRECQALQQEIKTLRSELQAIKTLLTQHQTPSPERPETPANEKKRKLQSISTEDAPSPSPNAQGRSQYVTKVELQQTLSLFASQMNEQFASLTAQLTQISTQQQQTFTILQVRMDKIETSQQTTIPGRLSRNEKPYQRPELVPVIQDIEHAASND